MLVKRTLLLVFIMLAWPWPFRATAMEPDPIQAMLSADPEGPILLRDQPLHVPLDPFPQQCRSWQLMPDGLMFPAYLASGRESRFASQWVHERDRGWLWDVALGGRVGILRHGNRDPLLAQGWQIDIEGAAFPRLELENRDLISVDFRFGIPITARLGPLETKFAYYHLSSHLSDEFMISNPKAVRINLVRDAIVWAVAIRPHQGLRFYAEAGWAFNTDGRSKPWEFQFGAEYSPIHPTTFSGAPFFAVNGRIREEVDFGGSVTVQTGWQWRGETGRLFRLGVHYFNGKTDQYQFFEEHEEQFAFGVWYDY